MTALHNKEEAGVLQYSLGSGYKRNGASRLVGGLDGDRLHEVTWAVRKPQPCGGCKDLESRPA